MYLKEKVKNLAQDLFKLNLKKDIFGFEKEGNFLFRFNCAVPFSQFCRE